MKRHWGRLLWVILTNGSILIFSIYVLLGVHQQEINSSNVAPPLWTVFYDNPHLTLAFILTGIGLLLEALNRREAGFVNCSLWLAFSIYSYVQGEPSYSSAVVAGIFVGHVSWYCLLNWHKIAGKPRLDDSGR